MQKKILGLFFIVLFLGIVGILYALFNYTEDEVVEIKEYPSPLKKERKDIKINSLWIDGLAKSSTKKFTFPINELFMQIDLYKYIPPKTKSYKLIISNVDRYSMFCIIQTLSSFNLPFVLSKENRAPTIYISSKNPSILKKIIKKLKEYSIDSKIVEVWL